MDMMPTIFSSRFKFDLSDLDHVLNGGLQRSFITHFHGASGTAKTMLATQMGIIAAASNYSVIYMNRELRANLSYYNTITKRFWDGNDQQHYFSYVHSSTHAEFMDQLRQITQSPNTHDVIIIDSLDCLPWSHSHMLPRMP